MQRSSSHSFLKHMMTMRRSLLSLLLLQHFTPTHSVSVSDFCTDRSLSQLQYGGAQASMVQEQASVVQNQADQLDAVAMMQQLRGGDDTGDSMGRIMKTHAWETKGLRYSQSLVFFAAPPIALGIIFFLWWIITSTCRCCDTIELDVCCSAHCGKCVQMMFSSVVLRGFCFFLLSFFFCW